MAVVTTTLPSCKPLLLSASSAPAKRPSRIAFLDVVRGLAALTLLLQHGNEVIDRRFLFWSCRWLNLGRAGMAAFFLASGFLIPQSLERSNSLRDFWIGRFFRLYPVYWTSLLMAWLMYIGDLYPFPIQSQKAFLFNLTMFQEFLGQPHIIGLYWLLTLEMVFYIAFSALFALGMHRKSLLWAWLGLGVMVAMGLGDLNGIKHNVYPKLPLARFALLEFALIGTVIFRYCSGSVTRRQMTSLIIGAIIALALSMRLGFRGPTEVSLLDGEWSWLSFFLSYFAGGVLFAVAFALRERKFPTALRWLGRISYSIYPMHYAAAAMVALIPHDQYPNGLVWILAMIVATCAIASASYLLIERPAIELGRRLLRKPESLPFIFSESQALPATA